MGYERFSPLPRDIPVVDTVYRVWQPPDLDALIDVAAFERDERIPYWANVWESAIVLAEEVAALDGRGRSFLELGCGIGLPAIVAARRGFAATATDYEDDALEAVRYNAERNGATGLVSRLVDWRNPPDDLRGFDHVVAADVLYENHHAVALVAMIARTPMVAARTALLALLATAAGCASTPEARAERRTSSTSWASRARIVAGFSGVERARDLRKAISSAPSGRRSRRSWRSSTTPSARTDGLVRTLSAGC